MDPQLKSNLTSSKHWIRLLYMLLFALFLYVASFVVAIMVIVQFLFALITGSDNRKLRELGGSLTIYIKDALLFLTFNSEAKPFPFADWPAAPVSAPAESVIVEPPNAVVTPAPVMGTAPVAEPDPLVEPEPVVDADPVPAVDPAPVADPAPVIVPPPTDESGVEPNPEGDSKPVS